MSLELNTAKSKINNSAIPFSLRFFLIRNRPLAADLLPLYFSFTYRFIVIVPSKVAYDFNMELELILSETIWR